MAEYRKSRRQVVQSLIAGGIGSGLAGQVSAEEHPNRGQSGNSDERPNILLLCAEDVGAQIPPYDTPGAIETSNIRDFASESLTYDLAWSNSPICAPARTCLGTGMYANSLGAEHMRSEVEFPDEFNLFHQQLAANGYETVNHGKTDYNLDVPGGTSAVVDGENWTSDAQPETADEPFYMQLNYGDTHEGPIFEGVQELYDHDDREVTGDYSDVNLPEFYPDTDLARTSLGVYQEKLRSLDEWVGEQIQQMKENGLWEDTIVILWGDHGPGLPRGKRSLRDFGLRVPVIAHIPQKYRESLAPPEYEPGSIANRPISFVDFGPTFLSLAGIEPPEYMQGEPFMGEYEGDREQYLYGFVGRIGERYDLGRTVRDERYQLIRNYMPHRIYAQHTMYQFQNPVYAQWRYLEHTGEISPEAASYFQEKPPVELYDLENDPEQVNNLAEDPEYQDVRARLMDALHDWQEEIQDTGFLPEEQIYTRPAEGETPYEFAQSSRYNLTQTQAVAEQAAQRDQPNPSALIGKLNSDDPAVRYWAANGLLTRHEELASLADSRSGPPVLDRVRSAMNDEPDRMTRTVLAETSARIAPESERGEALQTLLQLADPEEHNAYVVISAWNALDYLDETAMPIRDELEQLSVEAYDPGQVRGGSLNDADFLKTKTLRDLKLTQEGKSPATWEDWPAVKLPW